MSRLMECPWVLPPSSQGPILANIIMTELENQVVSKLASDNTIKLYIIVQLLEPGHLEEN